MNKNKEIVDKLGLTYIGFGRYSNSDGDLYVSDGDSIKKFVSKKDRMGFIGNAKKMISDSEYSDILDKVNNKKILYSEKIENGDINKFFGKKDVTFIEILYSHVPKKFYELSKLKFEIILNNKELNIISYNENTFSCHFIIKKESNHYISTIKDLRFNNFVENSKFIRMYIYKLMNFYNNMGVVMINLKAGNSLGAYMWSRYGINFSNSNVRDKYKLYIKSIINDSILKKSNENEEVAKAFKNVITKINNSNLPSDISKMVIKLTNSGMEYISKRVQFGDYSKDNRIYIGKFLMKNTEYDGFIPLYPDSKGYSVYYDYMTFRKTDFINEQAKSNKIKPVPYLLENNKIVDEKIWIQDEFDENYEKHNEDLIYGK